MWVFCCFEVCFFFQKAYATHHHHHWMHSTGSWKSLMSTYPPPPPLFDISRMRDVKWGCCVFNKPSGKCSCSTSHFYMIKTTRQNTISTSSCALLYGIFYVFSFEYIMTTVNKLGWKVEVLVFFFAHLFSKGAFELFCTATSHLHRPVMTESLHFSLFPSSVCENAAIAYHQENPHLNRRQQPNYRVSKSPTCSVEMIILCEPHSKMLIL